MSENYKCTESIWQELKDHNLKNIKESAPRETSHVGQYGSNGHTPRAVGSRDESDGHEQAVRVEGQPRMVSIL